MDDPPVAELREDVRLLKGRRTHPSTRGEKGERRLVDVVVGDEQTIIIGSGYLLIPQMA